jgi:hypothetical protein
MNSIELLAKILNTYLCEEFLLASYSKYSNQLNELINAGLLFSCGKSNEIFCDKCDEPHYATLQKINNVLKWRCPETGFHDVDLQATDRDLYKVNLELLINKIQESLELKKTTLQRMKTEIEGLYNIENETLLYISGQNPLSDESLYNYINDKRSRSSRGMVFCTFEDFSNRAYEMPRGYKLVPFNKAVLLNENVLKFNEDELRIFVPEYIFDEDEKKVGRTDEFDKVKKAFYEVKNYTPEIIGKSIRSIIAPQVHRHLGSPKTPSESTVRKHLGKIIKVDQKAVQN